MIEFAEYYQSLINHFNEIYPAREKPINGIRFY